MSTTKTVQLKTTIGGRYVGGCDNGVKMPKMVRTFAVGIRVSGGGGSVRPTSGQIYPRGK